MVIFPQLWSQEGRERPRELLCLVIQDLRVLKKEKQEATLKVMSAFMLGVLPLQSTGSRERTKR